MTALDGSVNYPIRDCVLLAGNPLIKLRPNLGCFLFTWANRSLHGLVKWKQHLVLENFITEWRLPFAQISFMYRKLPRKRDKTKQSFTLNKLTEILLEVKVRQSTSHAYWVKPIIFGVLPNWL